MKKNALFLLLFIGTSAVLFSFIKPLHSTAALSASAKDIVAPVGDTADVTSEKETSTVKEAKKESLSSLLYEATNLKAAGLDKEVLEYALTGYQKLVEKGKVQNEKYLTIVDFSQSSRKKRFYLLDLQNLKLVKHTYVAHGKNTGVDKAERFSNIPESEQSSLGFYITKGTYNGKHGLSLKLAGMEEGFNDNAERRAIVMHGAAYVHKDRVKMAYMGRSQGCPALPEKESAEVIKRIKGGSPIFIYHPSSSYLKKSKLLKS